MVMVRVLVKEPEVKLKTLLSSSNEGDDMHHYPVYSYIYMYTYQL
jgi:hypothetical protein